MGVLGVTKFYRTILVQVIKHNQIHVQIEIWAYSLALFIAPFLWHQLLTWLVPKIRQIVRIFQGFCLLLLGCGVLDVWKVFFSKAKQQLL